MLATIRKKALVILFVMFGCSLWLSAGAADYPNRPIRLIVASAAGGTGDTLVRGVSRLVARELKGTIVIDNRAGANGIVAAETVATAEPNGYTLLNSHSAIVTNAATGRKLSYDVWNDFVPITSLASAEGYLLLVNPNLKASSVKELIAIAKTKNILYGSPGTGNANHFLTEWFIQQAGTTMTHVPYKATAPAIIALISGEIQVLLVSPIATLQHIHSGRLRALASFSEKRMSVLPDLPTMEEAGFPGLTMLGGWQGWFAPAKTPPAIVTRLQLAVAKVVKSKEMSEFMQNGGYVPDGRSPDEFRALVMSDYKRFCELAKIANIKVE